MSELNMSSNTDWYCTKNRVAHLVGRSNNISEINDYDMDIGWKWVNGELAREEINYKNFVTELRADHNIEMAMAWYVCDVMTNVISGNQHQGRILPDGRIGSQSLGQGETSITYQEAKPTEVYDEMGNPSFYLRAQRWMKKFMDSLTDEFKKSKKSVVGMKNAYDDAGMQSETDYANRTFRGYGIRGSGYYR